MNPNVFEFTPLDMGIARVQFNLKKSIGALDENEFDTISERYMSKNPTMPFFTVDVCCFRNVSLEKPFVLQVEMMSQSGTCIKRTAELNSKEALLQVIARDDFLFFCKKLVVELLGDDVLDEEIKNPKKN
jgi:hypothetical protein